MTFQSLFVPLYFDETELDLWEALQRVEPEKRSSFIKETLRQALSTHELFSQFLISENTAAKTQADHSSLDDGSQIKDVKSKEAEHTETFSLEDLFTQTNDPQPEETPDIKTIQAEPKSLAGFEYVMKHIIGMEDDETILKILKGERS